MGMNYYGGGGAGFLASGLMFIGSLVSLAIESLTHRHFGAEYLGAGKFKLIVLAIFAVLVALVWASAIPTRIIFGILAAGYVFSWITNNPAQEYETYWVLPDYTSQPGPVYSGEPWLARVLPIENEHIIKTFIEPPLVFVAAIIFGWFSPGVSTFLIIASFVMLLKSGRQWWSERNAGLGTGYGQLNIAMPAFTEPVDEALASITVAQLIERLDPQMQALVEPVEQR